ncbi:hypothetical protein [uncultured Psychroserpens sp.]|uniref:hypothetical protein n=1 Tax=uncultured Psychroserpens sp. TaxID=255436 RepID=UPI0026286289|nr:hypothetical protein [uncultured Psychroserpens sp.]
MGEKSKKTSRGNSISSSDRGLGYKIDNKSVLQFEADSFIIDPIRFRPFNTNNKFSKYFTIGLQVKGEVMVNSIISSDKTVNKELISLSSTSIEAQTPSSQTNFVNVLKKEEIRYFSQRLHIKTEKLLLSKNIGHWFNALNKLTEDLSTKRFLNSVKKITNNLPESQSIRKGIVIDDSIEFNIGLSISGRVTPWPVLYLYIGTIEIPVKSFNFEESYKGNKFNLTFNGLLIVYVGFSIGSLEKTLEFLMERGYIDRAVLTYFNSSKAILFKRLSDFLELIRSMQMFKPLLRSVTGLITTIGLVVSLIYLAYRMFEELSIARIRGSKRAHLHRYCRVFIARLLWNSKTVNSIKTRDDLIKAYELFSKEHAKKIFLTDSRKKKEFRPTEIKAINDVESLMNKFSIHSELQFLRFHIWALIESQNNAATKRRVKKMRNKFSKIRNEREVINLWVETSSLFESFLKRILF